MRIDEDLQNSFRESMDVFDAAERAKRTRVVDLVPAIKKRELKAKHEWTLTAEDLNRIAADLWPGIAGPAPEVTSVKGKAPRSPPLTFEAKHALGELADHVMVINRVLEGLTERALEGLAFEAVHTSTHDDEAIWAGIGQEAKRREAIRAAHRTGKGEWYAIVEMTRAHDTHPYLWAQVAVEHVKCASRKEAVEAGRKVMAEKVEWLSEGTFVEVAVHSALEWRPEDWG